MGGILLEVFDYIFDFFFFWFVDFVQFLFRLSFDIASSDCDSLFS